MIAPQGCEGSGIPANCSSTRGSIFNYTASTTWQDNGPWNLAIEDNLGTNYAADEGEFGYETVGLGFQGSGGPSLNHTVTAALQTMDFYIGMLGLNPRPTNFTDLNDPQPSYLNLLYTNQQIPSLSYGYTAGAQYRQNGILGSLTLGGYDDSLSDQNGVSFPFYYDQSRDLTVGLKSITGSGGQSLLPSGILTFIDSTVSQIWLPIEACEAFESTFGLVYDTTIQLYLVNDTQHATLLKQNTSLTFTLSPTLQGSADVNITFPYSAFDLEVSFPLVDSTQRYFPLHRADNDTQYTLGRTFLQEAHLIVDYGRSNFSLSQRTWAADAQSRLVDILPANATTATSTGGSGTSSGSNPNTTQTSKTNIAAVAAGAAVGAVLVVAAIAFGIWFFLRRRKRTSEKKKSAEVAAEIEAKAAEEQAEKDAIKAKIAEGSLSPDYKHELDTPGVKAPELYGTTHYANVEMSAEELRAELAAREEPIYELEAPHGLGELQSPDVGRMRSDRGRLPSQTNIGNVVDIHHSPRSGDMTSTTTSSRPFSWQPQDYD